MRINKRYKIIVIFLVIFILGGSIFFLKIQKSPSPNVILITIDALRLDHLSCYGYKRNTSPNIDKLAKEGVLFTQAISQSPYTPSSILSLLTSSYPRSHGVYNFGETINPGHIILPEILKNNGYRLALISGRGRLFEFHFPEVEEKFDYYYPSNLRTISADKVTQNAIEWLRSNSKRRFFLWLYYLEPHTPYKPPIPYNQLYVNDLLRSWNNRFIPLADDLTTPYYGYKVIPRITAVKGITDVNYYVSQYDGAIRFVDSQIGVVIEELKRLNLYDNTLIIIHSDHGESMGEHGYYFVHGDTLYDELLKIPLIMKYRSIGENKRVKRQVQAIDIMPTILDIVGIKITDGVMGITLLPLIKLGQYYVKYAFSEKRGGEVSIRTESWKLIHNNKKNLNELYNLKADPAELNNLVGIEEKQAKFLEKELHSWMYKIESKSTEQKQVLDEAVKEKLKSLGYAQ